ncbi:hypothetical protein ERO13_A10G132300v2 [Gossypium hirsutum]|uniref:Transmembrane protein n=3 Tax=Gossypium TaxID=3633 RepID=A0A1U8JJ16_GOSHI|nr:uncharacterized protein LOC107905997 [Gossypium hirsutum]KAB2062264.1 hypothetical protein ES319_A10G142500v1 [Gossypium barbadense]KAG4179884.1 hypothetical protein ERO13_A10G132300v2 [Gossypium hirsutum]TYG98952.1 hypothetical protein ES288_A10G158300v1 [Gossypium darwinii]
MLYKKSVVHLILVLLLSFSLLLPPSSTTNTHLTVKERNEVIHRDLGGGKPTPCPPHYPGSHAHSGLAPCHPHSHGCHPHVDLTSNHSLGGRPGHGSSGILP